MNIKQIKMANEVYNVFNLNDGDVDLPEYGIVFENGFVISCPFGLHLYAYAIGSMLLLAETLDENEFMPSTYRERTIKEFKKELKEATDINGIINEDVSRNLFSLYDSMKTMDSVYAKERWPGLYKMIRNVSFINAKNNEHTPNKVLKEYSEKWLIRNRKYIWGIRLFYYMLTDEDFWVENSKKEYNKLVKSILNVNLPSKSYFENNYVFNNSYKIVTELPHEIASLFHKDDYHKVFDIFDSYNTIRKSLGVTNHYGRDWVDNFTTIDLDYIIFKEQLEATPIIDKMKEIKKHSGNILVNDLLNDVTFKLNTKDIHKFSFSSTTDEAYIDFKTPQDLLLKKMYSKDSLVKSFVIDKDVKINIIK